MLKKEDIKITSFPDRDRMERRYRASLNFQIEGAVSEYAANSVSSALDVDALMREQLVRGIFNKFYGDINDPLNQLYREFRMNVDHAIRSASFGSAGEESYSKIIKMISPAK